MSVTVARSSGFCWGVRRAVDLVLAELKRGKGPFRVVGPLVHNPLVLEALAERGVECCEDPCTTDGGVLFLRTHGTTLEERRILSENESVKIKDLTCPRVGRALSVAGSRRAEGHDVIILGDPGHQEVRALRSYAGGELSFVIQGPSDVAALPPLGNPFLLSQTTQDYELFDRTVEALLDRFPNLRWENTICESTSSRQEELRRLFPNADCVVVVGGRDSANTARLAAIAGDHGLPAMLVEKAEDLDPAVIGAFRRIVLTAGASTPSWAIRRVLGRLQEIQGTPVRAAYRILRNLVFANWHILVTALLIGLAGGAMTGRSAMSRLLPSVVSALVLFALHNFNAILESGFSRVESEERQVFIRKRVKAFAVSGLTALAIAVCLALRLDAVYGIVYALSLALYAAYSSPLLGSSRLPPGGLRAIPGSRDILFALGWVIFLSLLPVAAESLRGVNGIPWPGVAVWSLHLFFLFLGRSLMMDLVDIQGDAMIGRDTIPLALGVRNSRNLLLVFMGAPVILTTASVVAGFLPVGALFALVGNVYLLWGYSRVSRTPFPGELITRIAGDGALFAAGAASLAFALIMGR